MNKRSAMLMASGLLLTLLIGGLAIAMNLTGPQASSAKPLSRHSKPIVRTVTRTVTVHKKAKAQPAPVVQVTSSAPTSTAPSSASSDDSVGDDQSAYEDGDHGEHEDGEYEDGDHGEHEDGDGHDLGDD